MPNDNIKTDLEWLQWRDPKNLGKLISICKRNFDEWATEKMHCNGYTYFKMAYMPFLMNIEETGTTNNELAKIARVSKQAMSKVVKELLANDLIIVQRNGQDARSQLIFLSGKGAALVIEAKKCVFELNTIYNGLLGTETVEHIKECLLKISEYHDLKRTSTGI